MGLGLSLGKYLGLSSGGALLGPNGSPTSCSLTVISDTELQVDWTNGATNQDGTYVLYKLHSATEWSTLTALGALTTKNITGLTAGSNYDVKVTHYKGSKLSDYSNTANSYTLPDSSKFLFLGNYSQIADGKMNNTLSTDYLTIAGSVGSETYTCPDNATYKTADEDYIWNTSGGVVRNATTAELKGYDFNRTFIRYNDSSPNSIVSIAILKSGSTLTTSEKNVMRILFHLSAWWDDTLSSYGYIKDNRGNKKNYWKTTNYEIETDNLIARMVALGEEPDSARKTVLNNMFIAAKTKAFFTKTKALWLLASHGQSSSLLNIFQNNSCELLNTPTFSTDAGWTTNGSNGLKTNFIPSVSIDSKDSVGLFLYETLLNTTDAYVTGCSTGTTSYIILNNKRTNSPYGAVTSATAFSGSVNTSSKFSAITRNSSSQAIIYTVDIPTMNNNNSIALPNVQAYIGGYNKTGTLTGGKAINIRMEGFTTGLTQMDIWDLIEVFVTGYLTSIGAN